MPMSRIKQEQEGRLKEALDKDLVVLKDSMISLGSKEVKVANHLEMCLKNLKSFSLEVKEEQVSVASKQLKEKT